jgi:hypothetical protein
MLHDIGRPYMRNVTYLHGWQLFMLADHLEQLILQPGLQADGTNPDDQTKKKYIKFDHIHRLYFCLVVEQRKFLQNPRKASLQEDTVDVLQAIVEGLDDELQWPDAERRQEIANVFLGIGVADVKKYLPGHSEGAKKLEWKK